MLPNRIHWLRFKRCIDAYRGPDIRRGLFCGRRRCDTFAQTVWTREKAPWARASGRERGIRKHDDTFNRIAFLEPGNGGGPHCSQRLGENHLSRSAVGPISHPYSLGKPGGRRNQPTSISRICRTRLPELFRRHGSLPHAISSSTLLSLGRRGNRPPTSTRSAAPSESPHISTSRPVNSRQE